MAHQKKRVIHSKAPSFVTSTLRKSSSQTRCPSSASEAGPHRSDLLVLKSTSPTVHLTLQTATSVDGFLKRTEPAGSGHIGLRQGGSRPALGTLAGMRTFSMA